MNMRKEDINIIKKIALHVEAIKELTKEFEDKITSETSSSYKLTSEMYEILERRSNIIDSLTKDPDINKFLKVINRGE